MLGASCLQAPDEGQVTPGMQQPRGRGLRGRSWCWGWRLVWEGGAGRRVAHRRHGRTGLRTEGPLRTLASNAPGPPGPLAHHLHPGPWRPGDCSPGSSVLLWPSLLSPHPTETPTALWLLLSPPRISSPARPLSQGRASASAEGPQALRPTAAPSTPTAPASRTLTPAGIGAQ